MGKGMEVRFHTCSLLYHFDFGSMSVYYLLSSEKRSNTEITQTHLFGVWELQFGSTDSGNNSNFGPLMNRSQDLLKAKANAWKTFARCLQRILIGVGSRKLISAKHNWLLQLSLSKNRSITVGNCRRLCRILGGYLWFGSIQEFKVLPGEDLH